MPKPVTERKFKSIYYEVGGPGGATAVVFTHGFALDHETWREQIEALSETYRTLAWDVPGCGDAAEASDPVRFDVAAEMLLDVLHDEGINRAVLVGQSMGSVLNQYVAHHHPDRVQALVHVGGVPLHEEFSNRMIKLMGLHVWIVQLMPERLLYNLFGWLVAHTDDAQEYVKQVSARTGKANMVALERKLLKDLEQGIPTELTAHPHLIVVGENEYAPLRRKARKWSARLPDSEYATLPDAGHLANHDNPTAFNKILSSFLEALDW